VTWITRTAIAQEEEELLPAIHPQRCGKTDATVAGIAVLVVVGRERRDGADRLDPRCAASGA
jgi:hypothetical protein